jgi:hypothetical protein
MWKNNLESDRPQTTIWRTRISCWINKATNTNSENVNLTAFPLQQWFQEQASMLRKMPVLLGETGTVFTARYERTFNCNNSFRRQKIYADNTVCNFDFINQNKNTLTQE